MVIVARSVYLLFKRTSNKKTIYYVKIWLPAKERYTTAKSTAVIADSLGIDRKAWPPSSKAGARHIAEAWLAGGGGVSRKNDPLLWEYCLHFWDWDKSEYIKGKKERGQQIGRHHCASSYFRIKEYVQPRTQRLYLSQVTAAVLDSLQLLLKQELPKQSGKSINHIMSAVNVPIREAYRLGLIPHNPAQNFRSLANCSKCRGILSTAETKKLFELPWEYEAHRLAVFVAYCTGARLGEIVALNTSDLDVDFQGLPVLWIRKSWSATMGLKSTKTGNIRLVPIGAALRDDLCRLAEGNPHENGFIFYGPDADKPLSAKVIERGFYKQLYKIGIDERQRKEKGLCFHSLRHGFNSALRGSIPDETLRLATGHTDPNMTNLYDHITDSRLAEIRRAQKKNILFFEVKGVEKNLSDFKKNLLTIANA